MNVCHLWRPLNLAAIYCCLLLQIQQLGSGEHDGVLHSCLDRAPAAETTHTGGTFIAREGSPARLEAVSAAALVATREASPHGAFRVASSRIGGGVAGGTT